MRGGGGGVFSDLTTYAHKGCKIGVAKQVFADFFLLHFLRIKTFTNKGCKIAAQKKEIIWRLLPY